MTQLQELQLKQIIPHNLQKDERVMMFSQALDNEMQKIAKKTSLLNYKSQLTALDEDILDHMLYESHITWREGLSLVKNKSDKINLITEAANLHRLKGTKKAIELVFQSLNLEATLEEWFQYDGNPYHFKINIELSKKGLDEDEIQWVEDLLNEFKNERSHLETITFFITSDQTGKEVAAHTTGEAISVMPELITMLVSTDTCNHVAGHVTGEAISIMPELITMLVSTDSCNHVAKFISAETLIIYP